MAIIGSSSSTFSGSGFCPPLTHVPRGALDLKEALMRRDAPLLQSTTPCLRRGGDDGEVDEGGEDGHQDEEAEQQGQQHPGLP